MQQQTGATNARCSASPACARRCGDAGPGRMVFAAHAARAGEAGA
ncbi:hypothetical protein BLA18109_04259 [Burkholderia lata]|uniref:Uncharacterized protein n=1 Tax=Burkholderia lata (strain ATCC 17760 / DSM 23089 / LMG 22485 / NCIMB 9086 / R18194 / 383) TaxID=482957 RepID=A0A6P2WBE4_BURL3|nr:hypothetical protein BLA18109_04259 [Burkholderia lata]